MSAAAVSGPANLERDISSWICTGVGEVGGKDAPGAYALACAASYERNPSRGKLRRVNRSGGNASGSPQRRAAPAPNS